MEIKFDIVRLFRCKTKMEKYHDRRKGQHNNVNGNGINAWKEGEKIQSAERKE